MAMLVVMVVIMPSAIVGSLTTKVVMSWNVRNWRRGRRKRIRTSWTSWLARRTEGLVLSEDLVRHRIVMLTRTRSAVEGGRIAFHHPWWPHPWIMIIWLSMTVEITWMISVIPVSQWWGLRNARVNLPMVSLVIQGISIHSTSTISKPVCIHPDDEIFPQEFIMSTEEF